MEGERGDCIKPMAAAVGVMVGYSPRASCGLVIYLGMTLQVDLTFNG